MRYACLFAFVVSLALVIRLSFDVGLGRGYMEVQRQSDPTLSPLSIPISHVVIVRL